MKVKRVIILGGGLAGLSCAYHLQKEGNSKIMVIEKSDSVGGTARSVTIDGFTFDFTGHLLHLHHPYTKKLIQKLLRNNLYSCVRNAAIYSHGLLTPYPFQVNTYGLPKKVVSECVNNFLKAAKKYSDDKMRSTSLPFSVWSQRTFGQGFHKYFMKPYNEKLWQIPLNQMTAQWCGMFVPQPRVEDVVSGSRRKSLGKFGYNVTFLYPKRGGIQVLAQSLAKSLPVKLNTAFEELIWQKKKIKLSDGKWYRYDHLVSTVPLVELLKRIKDLPLNIRRALPLLRWVSVCCINLGVARSGISDKSWIYFPEKKFIFYRVGFPSNFTPHSVPKGCSSMYVEIAHLPEKKLDFQKPELLNRVRKDLESCGLLKKSDKIVTTHVIPIHYGYVIYTPERNRLTQEIFNFLNQNDIFSIGRYGEWKYSFMEEAILDGKKTAEKIC